MTESPLSPWLADIAANILAVVLIVLIVVGLSPRAGVPPQPLPATLAPPEGSAALVALLRQRLTGPGPALDLTPRGPLTARTGDGPLLLSVFSPRDHAVTVARLQTPWREITVPEALHAPDGSGYSAAFLALAPLAGDEAAFRRALARLLERAGGQPGTARALGDGEPGRGLTARFADAARVMLSVLAVALVLVLRRRAVTGAAAAAGHRGRA